METIDDIRQKRLQFFSKYIIAKNDNYNKITVKSENQNAQYQTNKIENKLIEVNDKITNSVDSKTDLNSAEILRKLFDSESTNKYETNKFKPLNHSISLDDTKNIFKNNRKLEEFKNIVESSYQNHVLNKTDFDPLNSRRMSTQSNNSFQAWNFSNQNSIDDSLNKATSSANFISNFNNDTSNNFIQDSEAPRNEQQQPLVNCKIPYMSAYNIYETKDNEPKMTLEKFFEPKKLTSNGSSINSSPTSLSSGSSIKKLNEVFENQIVEVRPPETPKTSNLTFRKNFLRKSAQLNQAEIIRNSLELTPKTIESPIEFNLPLKKSNQLPSLNKNTDTLDKIFDSKCLKNKNKLKKHRNIFKYLDDLVNDDQDDDHVHDHSDDENTLDIFSSDEESIENNNNKNMKNLDLKIDLAQLNTSDDDDEYVDNDFDFNEPPSVKEDRNQESNLNSSNRQQIKPDIIPNLILDQLDDDRSLSVAVSLAKSMCKEIDYQKEMEALFVTNPNTDKKKLVKNVQKITSKKPIQLNELKLSGRFSKSSSENSKQDSAKIKSSINLNNLKPPTSSRQSMTNNPEKPNLYRSKTVLGTDREHFKPTNDINLVDSLEQNNNEKKENLLIIQSVEIFQNKVDNKKISSQDEINQSRAKNLLSQSRTRIWDSSTKKLKRPSSASNKNQINKSIQNEVVNRPPSAGLFLNYSKLIEIESNIQKEDEPNPSRPKTAFSKLSFLNSNGNISEEKNVEVSVESEQKDTEFMSSKIDWLDLPHELWLKILKYLGQNDLIKLGRTCMSFNRLYTDNSLWKKVELKYKYDMKNEWLEWIGRRRPNELNIIQCSGGVTLSGISEMFRNIGENLQKLNLSRCSNGSLSGDNFALQASIRCPNVTSLDLSWTLLSNQTLKLIVDSFKKIESINLSGCNMIQEDGFNQLLLKHGENLKNLEISGCIHFSSNVILNIGAYCRQIERLNISNCHRMTNESVIEACPHWLKLKFLDLRGIKNIKNNCVSTLVRRCPNLEGLSLGECVHIGDSSILEIATYKSNIKQLDLNNCKKISDASIRSMGAICSQLEFLNLKGTSVTDTGLITLSSSKFIKTIEDLNLSFLPISEFVLVKLLKNAEKLKKIHLYGCYNIKHMDEIRTNLSNNGKNVEINI
ncbi:unnamed protein product [Brachionus calyciflorus]|uniref:F-box domain-containing protein n=1 Tax=Brachionus calyciflorus TaxID=104777 RepID=A0A813W364_9BILA|nr:unnamed protein product [Brachionus calyciflorus]